MSSIIPRDNLVRWARKNEPTLTEFMSDHEVYDWMADNYNPEKIGGEGTTFEPWEDPKEVIRERKLVESTLPSYLRDPEKHPPGSDYDVPSLTEIHKEASIINNGVAGWLGKKNEWDFLKYSQMQSLQDAKYFAEHGKSQYQLYVTDPDGRRVPISPEDYSKDFGAFTEVGAWMLGQAAPLDAAVWGISAGFSKLFQVTGQAIAGTKAGKSLLKYVTPTKEIITTGGKVKKVVIEPKIPLIPGATFVGKPINKWLNTKYKDFFVTVGSNILKTKGGNTVAGRYLTEAFVNTALRAPASSMMIGSFSSAGGYYYNLKEQRQELNEKHGIGVGELDYGKATWAGAKSFGEGLLLGTATAGTASLFSRPFMKGAALLEKSTSPYKKALAQFVRGPALFGTALSAEATVFATLPYLWHGAPKNEDGSTKWHGKGGVYYDMIHSGAVLAGLRIARHPIKTFRDLLGTELATERDIFKTSKKSDTNAEAAVEDITKVANTLSPAERDTFLRDLETHKKDIIDKIDLDEHGGKQQIFDTLDRMVESGLLEKIIKGEINRETLADMNLSDMALVTDTDFAVKSYISHLKSIIRKGNESKFEKWMDSAVLPNWKKQKKSKKKWDNDTRNVEMERHKTQIKQFVKMIEANSIKANKEFTAFKEKKIDKKKDVKEKIDVDIDAGKAPKKVKPVKKELIPVEGDVAGTPKQVVQYWKNKVESLKKSIKISKSVGEKENLRSQLKDASVALRKAQKGVEKAVEPPMEKYKGPPVGKKATKTEIERSERLREKHDIVIKEIKRNQKELLDEKGKPLPKTVLGTVQRGIARIRAGGSVVTEVHEMLHPILKTLRSMAKFTKAKAGRDAQGLVVQMQKTGLMSGEKRALYNTLRKGFIEGKKNEDGTWKESPMNKKDAKTRAIEEVWARIVSEYVGGKIMDKNMFFRVKDWIYKSYITVKSQFKSFDKLNEREISVLFGEKMLKGIDLVSVELLRPGGKMEFMSVDAGNRKGIVDLAIKKVKNFAKNEGIDYATLVKRLAQIANLGIKDFSLEMATAEQAKLILDRLTQVDLSDIKGKDPITVMDILEDVDTINRNRVYTDISSKDQKEWFEGRGVKSGDPMHSSSALRKEWKAIIFENVTDKSKIRTGDLMLTAIDNKRLKKFMSSVYNIGGVRNFFMKNIFSLGQFAESLGMDNMASWVHRHTAAELRHAGPILEFLNGGALIMMGIDRLGRPRWNKIKNSFSYLEANEKGEFIRLNDKTADPKKVKQAKAFIKKAFDYEVKKVKGKEKWYSKGLKWEAGQTEGNVEAKVLYYVKEVLLKNLQREFESIARTRYSKVGYEKLMKDNDIKFLNQTKQSFYLPRRMTNKFGETYDRNAGDYGKAIKKETRRLQVEMAKEQYKEKYDKASKAEQAKMAEEFHDMAREFAKSDFDSQARYGSHTIKNRNLVKRNRFKFPERHKNEHGKVIDVWESGAEAMLTPYGAGWGKFLANMEHAPWAVGLKGYVKTESIADILKDKNLQDLRGKKGDAARDLLQTLVEKRVGTFAEGVYNHSMHSWSRGFTSGLMRLQLGGFWPPATGVKNYLTQVNQMNHSFDFYNNVMSHLQAMRFGSIRETERKGLGTTIGIAGYTPSGKITKLVTGVPFKLGLQPLTEVFNKTWARIASHTEIFKLADDLLTRPEESLRYQYARGRLKEFYQLTNRQIDLIVEHGLEPNYGNMPKKVAELMKREIDSIVNQAELVGSIRTAGSTLEAQQTWWASLKQLKPWLMYKRIAFSSYENTARMVKFNAKWGAKGKPGHLMRTGAYFLGSALSGVSRIAMLKSFLGQTFPDENSPLYSQFLTALWQGEFLGILSDLFFSPYSPIRGGNILGYFNIQENPLFQNSLATVGGQFVNATATTFGVETGDTIGTAWDKFAKSVSASYTQYYKVMNLRTNPYHRKYKAIKSWLKDYNKLKDLPDSQPYQGSPSGDHWPSGKYLNYARIAFVKGDMEELSEAMLFGFWSYAADRYAAGAGDDKKVEESAEDMMNNLLTGMHPLAVLNKDGKTYNVEKTDFWVDLHRRADEGDYVKLYGISAKEMILVIKANVAEYEKRLVDFKVHFEKYKEKNHHRVDEIRLKFPRKLVAPSQTNVDYLKRKAEEAMKKLK